ncbi:MAG: antibiotic biosynthesis monooxygenase [Dehalococcoidia bacterium]|jgi:quinol monooxygenase YgiN
MYGTVARMRLKPGKEAELSGFLREFDELKVPGAISEYLYRMDEDSNEYYLVVVFADKGKYTENADDPEQDARYQKLRALLEADPEWHDGEIVHHISWM